MGQPERAHLASQARQSEALSAKQCRTAPSFWQTSQVNTMPASSPLCTASALLFTALQSRCLFQVDAQLLTRKMFCSHALLCMLIVRCVPIHVSSRCLRATEVRPNPVCVQLHPRSP